jgi:hypothetical protein
MRPACISEARTFARIRQKGCVGLAQLAAYVPDFASGFSILRAPNSFRSAPSPIPQQRCRGASRAAANADQPTCRPATGRHQRRELFVLRHPPGSGAVPIGGDDRVGLRRRKGAREKLWNVHRHLRGRMRKRSTTAGSFAQRGSFVHGDVVGLVALDLVLGLVPAGVAPVAFPIEIRGVNFDDRAADGPGFRIPADTIPDLEASRHGAALAKACLC